MPASRACSKTPLYAAFFCALLALGGCRAPSGTGELPETACNQATTPVAAVQGDGFSSPLLGEVHTVRGIVTWVEPDAGLYLEELASDDRRETSDALYVASAELAAQHMPGERLVLSGTVDELGEGPDTLTALTRISASRRCEAGVPLPISDARLPLGAEQRESLEAMQVSIRQALFVTDVYRLSRGQIRISANHILPAPTEVARPGADARAQAARNRDSVLAVRLAEQDDQPYSVGATVLAAEGLMGHDGHYQQLRMREPLPFMPVAQYRNPPPEGTDLRVVSLNLHNYFNGDGRGGGFPTERGAETPGEFQAQRDKLAAAVRLLQPHAIGVMELENDGFGPDSASADFLADLRAATGQDWAAVDPLQGPIGTDRITVGLFYRPDQLQALGSGEVLASAPFQRHSRQPVAQAFRHLASGQPLLIVVNHLKSKGSCPDEGPDANKLDGQGCWNQARTEAARTMAAWTAERAGRLAEGRALILGDMNAYRMEDPIRAILEAGYRDLTGSEGLLQMEYSYVYQGEAGTLDYAFASPNLARQLRSGRVVNINAGYPPGMALEFPWLGSSDHDPVVVDLRFGR